MKRNQRGKEPWREPLARPEAIHGPYWMRAHKDWRFMTVVILMLAALAAYVITSNLSWRPHSRANVMMDPATVLK